MIGVLDQATYMILNALMTQMFMIPKGIAEATCVVIGNAVGSNNVKLAKSYFRLTCGIKLAFVLIIISAVTLVKRPLVGMFTREVDVFNLTI